jgi:hypothetical protein
LAISPLAYYNAETHLFPELVRRFAYNKGWLEPEELYLMLDWKAPRARTRQLQRLVEIEKTGSFEAATAKIATAIANDVSPEQRLRKLMQDWGFLLPTASAILSVLYPEEFTIYDIRICDALCAAGRGDFHKLANLAPSDRRWSKLWQSYQQFVDAVRKDTPPGQSLRERDRLLWGADKQRQMQTEIRKAEGQ